MTSRRRSPKEAEIRQEPTGHRSPTTRNRSFAAIHQPLATDHQPLITRRWYALYTRPRHEKVVTEQLAKREMEAFLPVREVLSRWKDRRK
ncbi:MAG: transcription termination/antitermination NusG family protein, partial [Candidatus Methylomirabilales bacterium]